MAEAFFKYYQENLPASMILLRFLLESARYLAKVFRTAQDKADAAVRERRAARKDAQNQFCGEAAKVRAALEAVVAKPAAELGQVITEIARADRLAVLLHAQPGVPPSVAVDTVAVATASPEAPETMGAPTETSAKTQPAAAEGRKATRRVNATEGAVWFIGTLFGISVATERKILDFQAAKELEPDALFWLGYAMIIGACLVFVAHKAVFEAFRGAAERAAAEPAGDARYLNWATLRHTVAPTLFAILLAATEAVIMRNAFITANWVSVTDPTNLVHYLSGLIFLLPVSGLGAAQGWRAGTQNVARRAQRRVDQAARAQKEDQAVSDLRASAPAQLASSHDAYVAKLHRRKAEWMMEITRIGQPYEKLIAQLEMAFLADPEMTADEKRILQAAREDACAAYAAFLLELRQFRLWQEGRSNDPDSVNLVLTINRGPVIVAAPPAKLSLWQRIVRFFRRLRGHEEKSS